MDMVWLLILGLLSAGWFALDGFSIGLGMLLPALGRDVRQRRRVITAMAPFFLANEVWLIGFGGVLIAAFPGAEARILTGFYPIVVALIAAWLLRDASVWFRSRRESVTWRARWDRVLSVASVAFAVTTGLLFGSIAQGLPAPGAAPSWLTPYGVASAATVVALFALHGATFVAIRTTGEPRQRALRFARRLAPAAFVLLLALLVAPAVTGTSAAPLPAFLLGAAGLAGIVLSAVALRNGRDGYAFAATTISVISLPLAAGAAVTAGLLDGAADAATLSRLSILVLPVVPLVVAAQAWLWWIYRHRVGEHSLVFF